MQELPDRNRFLPYVSLGLALFIPISLKYLLKADIGNGALVLIIVLAAGINIIRRVFEPPKRWISILSMIANLFFGIVLLVGILITPLSAYQLWFESFKGGAAQGGVSNLMVLVTGFFSSMLAPTMLTMGLAWPFIVIGFVLVYLLAIVIQSSLYLYVVLFSLAGALFYATVRWVVRERRLGAYTFSLVLVIDGTL